MTQSLFTIKIDLFLFCVVGIYISIKNYNEQTEYDLLKNNLCRECLNDRCLFKTMTWFKQLIPFKIYRNMNENKIIHLSLAFYNSLAFRK